MDSKLLAIYNLEFGELPYLPEREWTDDEITEAILENKPLDELFLRGKENNNMEEQKIRKLLKEYGAEEKEIENFMKDLADMKDNIEEDNSLIGNLDKLKMSEEGKDIIANAPKMAKEELEQKIKQFLNR